MTGLVKRLTGRLLRSGGQPSRHVVTLLDGLWPPPAAVRYTGRRPGPGRPGHGRPGRSGSGRSSQYLPVPSLAAPKLLVPRYPRKASAAVLRGYRTSASGRTRLMIAGVAVAARVGLGDLLPHRVVVDHGPLGDQQGIDAYLREALGRDLELGVYIGPPRAVQKPVLQLVSPQGRTFAFAKVGISPYTSALVRTETDALCELATHDWQHLRVPTVLHRGVWQGHQVLVLAALERSRAGQDPERLIERAAVEVARHRGTSREPLLGSAYWQGLGARLANLAGPEAIRLAEAHRRLSTHLSGRDPKLEFGSWHGDWAGWNMTVAGDSVLVWDWEFLGSGVPVGFDAIHRVVQDAVVFGGMTPQQSYAQASDQSAGTLAPFGVPAEQAALTTLLYVMEIATRYLEVNEHSTAMANLASWLEPVLDRLLSSFDDAPASA